MTGDIRPAPGHPRDDAVEAASREMIEFYNGWYARHQLTTFECMFVLSTMMGRISTALCLAQREGIVPQKT